MKYLTLVLCLIAAPGMASHKFYMIDTLSGLGCLGVDFNDNTNRAGYNVAVFPECTGENNLMWTSGPSKLEVMDNDKKYCIALAKESSPPAGGAGYNVIATLDCDFSVETAWRPAPNSAIKTGVDGVGHCLAINRNSGVDIDVAEGVGTNVATYNVFAAPACDGAKDQGWYSHGKEPEGLMEKH